MTDGVVYERPLDGDRYLHVIPILFDRARLAVGTHTGFYDDLW